MSSLVVHINTLSSLSGALEETEMNGYKVMLGRGDVPCLLFLPTEVRQMVSWLLPCNLIVRGLYWICGWYITAVFGENKNQGSE